jgi:hypothetical protein
MNWQDLVGQFGHLFTNPNKRTFSPHEMAIAYQIMNGHDGTAVIDTGCSSCRRSCLTRVRKIIAKQNPGEPV